MSATFINKKLAEIMVRRFYLRHAGQHFWTPLYMGPILDQAELMWVAQGDKALLSSNVQPITELTVDDVQIIRQHIHHANTMLAFYKPYINPSLIRVEIAMLARAGINQLSPQKL